jgi:hypothetical protein
VEEAVPRLAAIMAEEMLVALRGDRPGRLVNPVAWEHRHPRGVTA